ncbi:MAG: metallophosphoesterase [Cyanobacteria bacterium]|nr:metallophosphoesterase [Cyanobacteriota bacterium]
MRRFVLLLQISLLAGCGGTPATRNNEARERPTVQALQPASIRPDQLALPNADRSIKFAIIGDSGRGDQPQHEVAAQMEAFRQRFDYKFVLMAGDNIYEGPATEEDYRLKFEGPYKALLDAGVKFYAALGNHDDTNQIFYKAFNMGGHRFYTFVPPVDPITRWDTRVRFFALDSTYLSLEQIRWFEKEVTESKAEWKIAFLHHPLYTSGRYGLVARGIRLALESSLVNGGVDVVFSGHEHIYERAELQRGILYFITGGAGSLRAGDASQSPRIARAYDQDYHFMLAEITDEGFFFQAINRKGVTVDAGALRPSTALRPAPSKVEGRRPTEDTTARR